MTESRIVLTGATGGLGSAVLKHILNLIDPARLIISLYNPSRAPESFASAHLDVRKGDYSEPASLDTAFAGAEILLLVSYPSIAHELRVNNHINAIDAAKRAGVKHVFYTSLAFAGPPSSSTSAAAVMRAHIDTEAYLKASGLTYTIIREGIYSESYPLYLGFFDPSSTSNEVLIPHDGDGGIAWACRDELGEATARLLVEAANQTVAAREFANQTVLLSGPEPIPLRKLAGMLSKILGRPITVKYVAIEEYSNSSTALSKLGREFAKLWATTYEALENGECSVTDPLLEKLLGRKPKDMMTVLTELLGNTQSAQGAIDQYAK